VATTRRLAAIMFTDTVGYTSSTQADEGRTLELLRQQAELVRPLVALHQGREIKSTGDGFLVEFDSALKATQCAVSIQRRLYERNAEGGLAPIRIRIGIHLGDVVQSGTDILGDAVNIAARIEPTAEPGGICVSGAVYEQVRNKIPDRFEKLEPKALKGLQLPIDLYRVVLPWTAAPETTSLQEAGPTRLAILPFASMSSDPENEYFADGMTEELIDRLAQVKELQVIARTSVMTFKKKEKKITEIAKELFVGSVVEGSVRKAGNKVRVTAQLINGATEAHLWSSHYDGMLDDIFAVQSEIAEKVAEELKIQLQQSEKRTLEKKPTENMEAYGNFLRGRELFREGSEQSLRQALKLFETVVELDPSFAKAYVGVAECHQYLGQVGYEPRDVMLPVVKASLTRALELDPDLAEAHASLATLHFNEDHLLGAEVEARRAVALNASLPGPYRQLAEIAGIKGELEEMVKRIETAYRLDPITPNHIYALGLAYLFTGRERELLEHWRKTEHLAPAATYRSMTDYYLSKGDLAKARELHAKFEKLQPTHPWVTYMGGFLDAKAGDKEKALQAIAKIKEAKMGPIAFNYVAYVYLALGDMDGYFENINRALDEHTMISTIVLHSPLLAKAREDPRYEELVEKLGKQTRLAI
jgi:adenylate cyclase